MSSVVESKIEGVIAKPLVKFNDDRGWLIELFRHDEIAKEYYPVMSYISMTRPGVARGPHEHKDQTDCFAFAGPSTFRLYLWDDREQSSSFGKKEIFDLGIDNPAMVIVPPGVVHAYKNIGTIEGVVFNAPNRLYAGWDKKEKVDEIRHEDEKDGRFVLE